MNLLALASTCYEAGKELPGSKRLYQFLSKIWQSNVEFQKIELIKTNGLDEDERLAWGIDAAINGPVDDILNEIGTMYKEP